jgi:hypothetical protein
MFLLVENLFLSSSMLPDVSLSLIYLSPWTSPTPPNLITPSIILKSDLFLEPLNWCLPPKNLSVLTLKWPESGSKLFTPIRPPLSLLLTLLSSSFPYQELMPLVTMLLPLLPSTSFLPLLTALLLQLRLLSLTLPLLVKSLSPSLAINLVLPTSSSN